MILRILYLFLGWVAAVHAQPVAVSESGDAAVAEAFAAARTLEREHKYGEARAAFQRVIALAPTHAEANCSLALYAADAGEWEKALQYAGRALVADPDKARHQYVWGAANGVAALKSGLLSRLGYAKKCLAAYRRAVELEPDTLKYRWALLSYYLQAPGFAGGSSARAREQAAEMQRRDAAQGRQAFVQIHLHEKHPEQAFALFEEVLRVAPDDYVALYQFGSLALQAGQRLDDGAAAFQHCLELAPPAGLDVPTHANVHWRLGHYWEKKQEQARARAEYELALQADPGFQPAQKALEKLGPPPAG